MVLKISSSLLRSDSFRLFRGPHIVALSTGDDRVARLVFKYRASEHRGFISSAAKNRRVERIAVTLTTGEPL